MVLAQACHSVFCSWWSKFSINTTKAHSHLTEDGNWRIRIILFLKEREMDQVWWRTPLMTVLEKQRQADL